MRDSSGQSGLPGSCGAILNNLPGAGGPVRPSPEFNLEPEDVRMEEGGLLKVIRRKSQIAYPLHTHSFSELVIITAGRGEHRVLKSIPVESETLIPVAAGDVFVIQGDEAHGYEEPDNLQLVNILFNPALLKFACSDLNSLEGFNVLFGRSGAQSYLRLDFLQLETVLGLVEKMENELRRGEAACRCMAVLYFQQLAVQLSRWHSGAFHPAARPLSRIGRVLAFLEKNTHRSVTLSELTGIAGFSVSTLTREFHRAVGFAP